MHKSYAPISEFVRFQNKYGAERGLEMSAWNSEGHMRVVQQNYIFSAPERPKMGCALYMLARYTHKNTVSMFEIMKVNCKNL